jgi:ATP-dependent helicase/nuclease subunit B
LNKFDIRPIVPDRAALEDISRQIWAFAEQTGQRPLVLLTTAGPAMSLRQLMEKNRPQNLPLDLAFLPEIQGLNQWLDQTPDLLSLPRYSMIQRWGIVYEALEDWKEIRQHLGALGEGGKWTLAQAIVAACDKLSESKLLDTFHTALEARTEQVEIDAQVEAVFQEALDQAYPDLSQQMVSLDGRLILAFWKSLSTTSDPVIRQKLAFSSRLKTANQALVWIESAQIFGPEAQIHRNFLEQYANQYPVLKFEMDWDQGALWPEALPIVDTVSDVSAIHQEEIALPVVRTIERHREKYSSSDWHLIACKKFEDIAWAATTRIEEHFANGRTNIALVSQDRLVARRMRALLARLGEGVCVRDATGWKLSTTQAAAAVHSWFEILRQSNGPSLVDLLGFLKNPFIDYELLFQQLQTEIGAQGLLDKSKTQDWLWDLECLLMDEEVSGGWSGLLNCFERPLFDGSTLHQTYALQFELLQFLRRRALKWQASARSGNHWIDLLLEDLKALGMLDALQSDEAGAQLLQALTQLTQLQVKTLSLNSWVALFELWLEQTSYIEKPNSGSCTVSIFPLSGIRLRTFDAVVMVGCDDRQLPSFSDPGLFFSNAFIRALGMKGMEEEYIQQARDLSALLISHQYVDLFWQEFAQADAQNRPASWLVRLMQGEKPLISNLPHLPIKSGQMSPVEPSKVAWDRNQYPLPVVISPSAYKTLRDCPYHFYVSRLLGLRQAKTLDSSADHSLIGQLLHRILKIFYQNLKTQDLQKQSGQNVWDPAARQAWMEKRLSAISDKIFDPYVLGDGRFIAASFEWKKQIPTWVEWQIERELSGWRFHDGECKVGFDLQLHEDVLIRIEGYADRLDLHPEYGAAVIDYKYQNVQAIKKKSQYVDDDPQLLIYAKAVDRDPIVEEAQIGELAWVGLKLKDDKPERFFPLEEQAQKRQNLIPHLARDLKAVWSGKSMHAYAPDSVCQYCDARGICRKGMWS